MNSCRLWAKEYLTASMFEHDCADSLTIMLCVVIFEMKISKVVPSYLAISNNRNNQIC